MIGMVCSASHCHCSCGDVHKLHIIGWKLERPAVICMLVYVGVCWCLSVTTWRWPTAEHGPGCLGNVAGACMRVSVCALTSCIRTLLAHMHNSI